MRRPRWLVGAVVILAASYLHTDVGSAAPCSLNAPNCPGGGVDVTQGGYTYAFDGENLVKAAALREQQSDPDGRVIESAWVPSCSNAKPDDPGVDGSCLVALTSIGCPAGEVPYKRYWREVAPNPQVGWSGPENACRAPAEQWTVAQLTAAIEPEFRQALVEQPAITMNPTPRGLVHVPVIASVTPLQDVGFAIANPVPGEVVGTPTYAWSFGEGPEQAGPGRPYDGTSPSARQGYYVAHPYDTRGTKTVTLTVRWQGVLTVAGLTVPLEEIALDYPNQVDVVEARSQLVAGTG